MPYNSFKFVAKRPVKDVYGGLYPNRDLIRYELHRVWKVEATLKQGMRHMFAKRTFYLDRTHGCCSMPTSTTPGQAEAGDGGARSIRRSNSAPASTENSCHGI
ncbi:MAG: DUF1329 domain-containing protein [Sulfuritalea sp.]|nr:DUF1329 domain-containing protein [Sulfuritalea sp.]